jgi:hypothetical protein
MAKITIKTGGNQEATIGSATTGHSLEITGTAYALIPVQVQNGADTLTYYLIAAPAWAFADKADKSG